MPPLWPRLPRRRAAIALLLVGLGLSPYLVDFDLGVFSTCVILMAGLRTARVIARRPVPDYPIPYTWVDTGFTFASSVIFATVFLGGALAFEFLVVAMMASGR